MASQFTQEDDDLLAELGVEVETKKAASRTPREERIIAGFEDIQRFFTQHQRAPRHGEDGDIFERLYAVRLDRLRALEECRTLLMPMDHQGLLATTEGNAASTSDPLDDDDLLAQLAEPEAGSDIRSLRHVRSQAELRTAEEIASRDTCAEFERFQPLFQQAERELKAGIRQSRSFGLESGINVSVSAGDFFILGGQLVYVAEVGAAFKVPNGGDDARLRVIYANGTESNLLRRSLQRALYKDEAGRRLTEPDAGPLFSQNWDDGDIESGTIYVLRSHSDHPFVVAHRELIHKIGVTGGKVETRIADAEHDATYLLAGVEVVATYKLSGLNRTKLEGLFHRLFASAQLDLTLQDRFGHPVKPREWFLLPLQVIDDVVKRILDGSITGYTYDPKTARLVAAR